MARLRRLFRFGSRTAHEIDADIRDEIAFHFDMRVQDLVERGWSHDAARQEARRQFGDVGTTAAYCRRMDTSKEHDMRWRRRCSELWQDLVYGTRLLRRQPGVSVVALLTIAIGVGATTLVFSVVHAVLLAPLPYPHADRLTVMRLSLPDYDDVRTSIDAFEDAGVFGSNLYLIDDDETEQVLGGIVTPGFFRTMGMTPLIGRAIEDRDGATRVVVLGHGFWQRQFGADPGVLGRTIRLSGTPHTIVGIMPAAFQFPTSTFQLWAGLDGAMSDAPAQAQNRALRIFQAVVRLRPTATQAHAQAQMSALADRLAVVHPQTNTDVSFTLVSVRDRLVGNVQTALLVALGSAGCLLFIACANVAGLTLARLTTRTRELAVRTALGAGRWRITRQLATESLLVAVSGGALGVLLAWWGVSLLPTLIGGRVPRLDQVALNLPVLVVAVSILIVGSLLMAAVPALHASLARNAPVFDEGARGSSDARGRVRLRSALVIAQIAVAVVVLSGSLVLARSFARLLQVDAGFAPDRLLTFNLPLRGQPTPHARGLTATQALDAIAALPGIEVAGGATGLAPVTAQRATEFEVEGRSDVPAARRRSYFVAASPGYFRALGARIVAGREFAAGDADGAPLVAVISETLARRFFPDGNAIGGRLRLLNPEYSNDWRTIVGVVADVRYQGLDDDAPALYTPFAQTPFPWIYVHVRTLGDPMAALGSIRDAVKSVDARLAVSSPRSMTALVADSAADPRFRTLLISLFAVAATFLAAIGLHGVVAFDVARRGREIAIRLALGATTASVRWRVLRQSIVLATIGVSLGLAGAAWSGGVLADLLYETTATDPVALGAVVVLLLLVAVVASTIPARRATRIQPSDALREG